MGLAPDYIWRCIECKASCMTNLHGFYFSLYHVNWTNHINATENPTISPGLVEEEKGASNLAVYMRIAMIITGYLGVLSNRFFCLFLNVLFSPSKVHTDTTFIPF